MNMKDRKIYKNTVKLGDRTPRTEIVFIGSREASMERGWRGN